MQPTPELHSSRKSSRDAILDAAEETARELGANKMTLEAVAARAGLSKGGLLYHFPSKTALLQAIVQRFSERLVPREPGPVAAQVIEARLARMTERPHDKRVGYSMIAAIADHPDILETVRQTQRQIWDAMRERDAAPIDAMVAWLAVEGLSFMEMFDTSPLTADERAQIERAVRALAGA